jgi:hypothetical protein
MTNSSSQIAFLFPGQGSQTVGMGKELADNYAVARRTFEEADEALGYKLSELCFEGPEEKLKLTEITQPAILTASVAAWRVLQEKGLKPDFVCCRAQPGRVFGARGRGHAGLCRCGADGSQSRPVYAGSGAGGRGGDGGNSWHASDQVSEIAAERRREKFARRPILIRPSKS